MKFPTKYTNEPFRVTKTVRFAPCTNERCFRARVTKAILDKVTTKDILDMLEKVCMTSIIDLDSADVAKAKCGSKVVKALAARISALIHDY